MHPDPQAIDELVRRIVEAVHPRRIVLFGSAGRGEMGSNSDLDVLVIMPDGTHRRKASQEIYRHMWGFGFAKDIVVVTESDVQEYSANPYMIIKNALEEGRELYHATESPVRGLSPLGDRGMDGCPEGATDFSYTGLKSQ